MARGDRLKRRLGARLWAVAGLMAMVLAIVIAAVTMPEPDGPAMPRTDHITRSASPVARADAPSPGSPGLASKATLRSISVGGRSLSYCSNGSIDKIPDRVTRVVFVVHGNDRGSCAVARSVMAAADSQQRQHTLVVAPRFSTAADVGAQNRMLTWTADGWSRGDNTTGAGSPVSSFAVLESLLDRVGTSQVVIAGFSGGGQYVNRFAASTTSQPVRFVITNPSSYLYFTPDRPGAAADLATTCPGYNKYRYGLGNLNSYTARIGAEKLKANYLSHQVTYLLGTADKDVKSRSMDKGCEANAQGPQRLARGRAYHEHLLSMGANPDQHQLKYVERGNHSSLKMFNSSAGREALFD